MKLLGLDSTQLPNHRYKKAEQPHIDVPNHLDREFDVAAPDTSWAGDITYIWTGARWAYLAVVIDLFARKPVGWALSLPSPRLDRESRITSLATTAKYDLISKMIECRRIWR
ncbi:DDE-type integrase/transposase/recombinase [Microbulbifer bruguierae]|uniref:DDE-type integrase/transposase/recombinase n=1 Tax=Microbulbifer bruguierae TaxID=3029061 RepID=UPI0038991CD2